MHTSRQADRAQAEQRILGSVLLDPDCVPKILNKLKPDDFSVRQNREIYLSIRFLSQRSIPVDAVTVLQNLRETGRWDEPSCRTYLYEMMSETPSSAEVDRYIAQMLSLSGMVPCDFDGGEGEDKPPNERPPPNL